MKAFLLALALSAGCASVGPLAVTHPSADELDVDAAVALAGPGEVGVLIDRQAGTVTLCLGSTANGPPVCQTAPLADSPAP